LQKLFFYFLIKVKNNNPFFVTLNSR